MTLTATDRAEWMALQVFISARQDNGRVVTHDLVDAVMSRDANKECGKANKETVRRIIRRNAESERVRVIFTPDERYWAIREQLHHMSDDQVHALRDEIVEGGDRDPRGWDKQLTDAISVRLSNRLSPTRLHGVEPVSIRLWSKPPAKLEELPSADVVVDAPHAVYVGEERKHDGIPAAHVRKIVSNLRFKRQPFHQDPADRAIVVENRRYVPQPAPGAAPAQERQHVRIVNDGPAEIIPTRQALDEINAAMMQPLVKRTVKRMSASKSTAHIVYRDGRTVYLRPATPGDTFPTPTERPTDAELTGDISAELADYYAETFQAIADGSALPVRADMIRPGMDVIAAHMDETRTVSAVTAFVGPGAPWVRPTWTFRSHDETTTGSTFPPDMHLMVTRASLDAVFGTTPAEDTAPAAAPLYAALAAYEATMLCNGPRDLDDLARHLHAVGKAAPTAHHREILEAQADVIEGAWEALRTAGNLRARNAAHDKARAAVERARAVILTVAPHAHRMHGTDMPSTAEEIRAAAVAYNAVGSTPEELSAIGTGTATVRVHCASDSGTGWNVTATITAGVDTPLGHIPAHPPVVEKFRRRDGREDAAVNARRVIGALFRVDVPVSYVLDRRV
ncbi:hypothetical protein ACIQVL_03210 [Streptomyces sp. NPDC090499]|uniref:hypothetical protein n=1 Tax=Streptomyces sp. NPDC090499 TaxID=3365965 RepID=UPI0038048DCA